MKTGVIGLGNMGKGIAGNLSRAGILTRIWNRTEEKAREIAIDLNVEVSDSPEALVKDCDLIILSVSADQDVLDLIERILPSLRDGKVIVDTSTTSVSTARTAAGLVNSTGADFLDAPVSGGVEGARRATMVMMVGGEEMALERVRSLLDIISKDQFYMGASGSGQATKAVNQIMAAGINQAVSEALAFADALSLDMQSVIDVTSEGAAGNWLIQNRGSTLAQNKFEPGFKLALHHKDLKICQDMALEMSLDKEVHLPLVEMTLIHYKKLMDAGMGEKDISALYTLKKNMFNTTKAD